MVHVVVAFIATVIDQQHICFVILLDNVHGMSYFVKARVSIAHYRPDIGGGGGGIIVIHAQMWTRGGSEK